MVAWPMQIVGVIPARFGSVRFPGKPLTPIGSKPLLQWVLEGARQSSKISKILVATDDARIKDLANSLGAECAMTASDLPTGSDRVWKAIEHETVDVVVNIQGDEPLISGEVLDALVSPFMSDPQLDMATLACSIKPDELQSKNTAKIVTNHLGEAIYFSRFPIPYSRNSYEGQPDACLKHIGIYAYRKDFLKKFCDQSPVSFEKGESLEQLRALYLGARIKVVKVDHQSWGVDTPEDVELVVKKLKEKYGNV
ncbi:MAG: 3-deoxy-manno-octulosonate cytidylyltransferase [Bdellovibrionales bacterium]